MLVGLRGGCGGGGSAGVCGWWGGWRRGGGGGGGGGRGRAGGEGGAGAGGHRGEGHARVRRGTSRQRPGNRWRRNQRAARSQEWGCQAPAARRAASAGDFLARRCAARIRRRVCKATRRGGG